MIAQKVIAKVTNRNIYDTEAGAYTPAAAVTSGGELLVTLKPTPPPMDKWPGFITVRFNKMETDLIRRALEVNTCR